MVLQLNLMRLVGTSVAENPKTQDATITTRLRGIVARPELAKYSEAIAKTVFDGRVWGSSLSTGMQPGLWTMELSVLPAGGRLASVLHCRLKDLRFASKVIKDGKAAKSVMVVTVVVEHEICPDQKDIVCAVPSDVSAKFETEAEDLKREAVGGSDA
jgi:hypothetical protein